MPGNSVKDHRVYKALRREGASKGKAARIANASANGSLKRGGGAKLKGGKGKGGKGGKRR
jgi:hypothetical protein